ncbi:hypothetical protein EDE08_101644 [Bradyrhizobium sp. R2.2-H]|jgi:hypothetical protein|uniref:hypothetical protein n=1 Tax=unclassified Bradyrhizobium TaxID=2631580 RepID=UPI00104EB077|nr:MULTISPECIES: hypothetical protein [unclassified Bradyrhizobium]TCU78862.1 hypothetical protein EDE10_101645 [Bradyrhizobium sp. Y-H1]TCU80945.1 hypothetical protein EDE08_101644 [Bradyrhizobium sp. R2.2-H]
MIDPYPKLAELKKQYPDDVARIEQDEKAISDLLRKQDYALQPVTQELLTLCRKDILAAQRILATDRILLPEARAELWHVIDARLWFVRIVAKDYAGELAQLDRELEAELSR